MFKKHFYYPVDDGEKKNKHEYRYALIASFEYENQRPCLVRFAAVVRTPVTQNWEDGNSFFFFATAVRKKVCRPCWRSYKRVRPPRDVAEGKRTRRPSVFEKSAGKLCNRPRVHVRMFYIERKKNDTAKRFNVVTNFPFIMVLIVKTAEIRCTSIFGQITVSKWKRVNATRISFQHFRFR